MNEYISREAAMTLPVLPREQRIQLRSIDEAFEEGWRQALENLAILPAADVVEVVRCRECVFGNMPCAKARYPDYFCADGKRKDGGQDDGTA